MRDHLARAERPVAADAYTARSDREIARQLLAIRAQEDPQNTNSGSATSIAPGELCALTPEFGPMFAIMIVFESPMNESFNTWDPGGFSALLLELVPPPEGGGVCSRHLGQLRAAERQVLRPEDTNEPVKPVSSTCISSLIGQRQCLSREGSGSTRQRRCLTRGPSPGCTPSAQAGSC